MSQARPFDPLIDQQPARFVVGIDLGTTNSAVSFVDTEETPWRIRDLSIPQLVAPGQIEAREVLPSFHYQAGAGEIGQGTLRLPWTKSEPHYAVGVWARDEGGQRAGRLIASAKSWLCHSGVDRTADLLPWHAAADVERLSPVEVSARYLRHMRDAWNHRFPNEPFDRQDIVLTLPASFDEVARELTVEAAARAGLPRVVLIEEPQAAFYAWVYRHRENWHQQVSPGQAILICDIGGGTTDFTLLRVRQGSKDTEQVQFHRVAVGDHLILGGDNLDLALARHLEQRLSRTAKLEPRQWESLVRRSRAVKETLLSDDSPSTMMVHLPGSGARLVGGGIDIEVTREEVRNLLVEGFLPQVDLDEEPQRRQSGFQEFGLPYTSDPAITRYLGQFLRLHRLAGLEGNELKSDSTGRPDVVLLNGGFFASPLLQNRLLSVLASWFRTEREPNWSPKLLDHDRLDLAVARGAAYYGMVRRGEGVRITANAARSYYVGIESDRPVAVCLLPGKALPGEDIQLPGRTFLLTVSEPVEFPLYVSSTRLTDLPGELVEIVPEQMKALPPIRTVIRTQRRSESGAAEVELHARLSEIGTIELWCKEVGRDRSWRLQFDVRSATQTDVAAKQSVGEQSGFFDEKTWLSCEGVIDQVFGTAGTAKPERLMKELGQTLGMSSQEWPPSLLRRIWEAILQREAGRRRSAAHEARWLNLLGFALRPGYGVAVDDWRVAETWRAVRGKLCFPAISSRVESLILWRRIAGGLTAGQQRAIVEPLLPTLRESRKKGGRKGAISQSPDSAEMWTLLGSLELLTVSTKIEFGDLIASLLRDPRIEINRQPLTWALGRLGQRIPVYGPLNTIVPVEKIAAWLEVLLEQPSSVGVTSLAVMQLTRRTDDRYRDVDEGTRQAALDWMKAASASDHLIKLIAEGGKLDIDEQGQVFGESLPKGLRLV